MRTRFVNIKGAHINDYTQLVLSKEQDDKDQAKDPLWNSMKPSKPGVYCVKYKFQDDWVESYSFWDGSQWKYTTGSMKGAYDNRLDKTYNTQDREWKDCGWKKPEKVKDTPDPWADWSAPGSHPVHEGVYRVSCKADTPRIDWQALWANGQWHAAVADRARAAQQRSKWCDGPESEVRFKTDSRWTGYMSITTSKEAAVSKAAAPNRNAPARRRILLLL